MALDTLIRVTDPEGDSVDLDPLRSCDRECFPNGRLSLTLETAGGVCSTMFLDSLGALALAESLVAHAGVTLPLPLACEITFPAAAKG